MRFLWRTLYSLLLGPLVLVLAHLAALGSPKVRQTLAGRRGLWARAARQMQTRRPGQPLVWFHVASAGEFLQAEPLMQRFLRAGYQCAVTVTSVTGYRWAGGRQAATPGWVLLDYLPFDTRANARRMLALLQPRAVVFVKYDLWPNLVWELARAGVPAFLASGTLHPGSRRHASRLGRSLHATLYAALRGIFAVTEGDRERFLAACPEHPRVVTVGDTRFDSVLARKNQAQPPDLPAHFSSRPVFVVGSAWPADEAEIFPALTEALGAFPELVALVVPHEVNEGHLAGIEAALAGFRPVRFSRLTAQGRAEPRVVVVDAVGLLASLYAYGAVAYVGGGFGVGVHNVAEPLAMGVPTLFGPRHHNAPEAVEFVKRGFCFSGAGREAFRTILFRLLSDLPRTRAIGAAAAQAIAEKAGATEVCFRLIEQELETVSK